MRLQVPHREADHLWDRPFRVAVRIGDINASSEHARAGIRQASNLSL